eukprot:2031963-Prymnesium_polylepis.1
MRASPRLGGVAEARPRAGCCCPARQRAAVAAAKHIGVAAACSRYSLERCLDLPLQCMRRARGAAGTGAAPRCRGLKIKVFSQSGTPDTPERRKRCDVERVPGAPLTHSGECGGVWRELD